LSDVGALSSAVDATSVHWENQHDTAGLNRNGVRRRLGVPR